MNARAFLEQVTTTIARHEMLAPGHRVLVAYSGGADSTVLLHVLHRLDYEVVAGHVHHGLRGEEADAEEAHAAAFAATMGIPFAVRHADARAIAEEQKLSLEAAAREVRYRLLEEMAQEASAERIATGHTADDQAETVLLHLVRGTGPTGLSGIPPVRGQVVRPLLHVTHAEVRAYAASENLSFRTDSSNRDRRFTRNRIRHDVLPALAEMQPNVVGAVCRLAEIMREENAFLSSLVEQMVQSIVVWGEEEARMTLHDLHSLPTALQRRLLRRVIAIARDRETDIEFERIEAVVELVAQGQTGAVIELPDGLEARRSYGEITISPTRKASAPSEGVWLLPVPGEVEVREFGVVVRAEESADTEISDDAARAVLDAATLTGPLVVRTWRDGDRFVPLGQTEAMKLQDFFVNAKVPRGERHRVLLVLSGEEIVWAIGHRIGERYKVTPNTRRSLRLRVERLGPGE